MANGSAGRLVLVCASCRHGMLLPVGTSLAAADAIASLGAGILGDVGAGVHDLIVVRVTMDVGLESMPLGASPSKN